MNFSVALVLPVSEPMPNGFRKAVLKGDTYSALCGNLTRPAFNDLVERYKLHSTRAISFYEDSLHHNISGVYFESQGGTVCAVVDCWPDLCAAGGKGRPKRVTNRLHRALSFVYRDRRLLN